MTGAPKRHPDRVLRLIAAGRLKEQSFTREEVAALWTKAVTSARDALLPDISLDGALRAAYDGALNGSFAVLAAYGLRPSGGQGHHEATFAAVEALNLTDLTDLVPESEGIRTLRKSSVYDPILAEEDDRERALAWMTSILPRLRAALLARDPSRTSAFPEPPTRS